MNLAFLIHLTKEGVNGIERIEYYFRQDKPFPVIRFHQSEINKKIDDVINSILENVARWVNNGSGWVIERVETVYLDFARFQVVKGSGYILFLQRWKTNRLL